MGPELSTAAADQHFAWICKQHQYLIGLVLIFRTKIIWSGPEFGLVRCGYLNTAIVFSAEFEIALVKIIQHLYLTTFSFLFQSENFVMLQSFKTQWTLLHLATKIESLCKVVI